MILRSRFSVQRSRPHLRAGFTLLEILLAAILAGLLLAALYAALYTTLLQTQATRDAVESEDLARGIFHKMNLDLTGTLSPLPPKSGGNSAASGGTVAPASSTTAPADGSTAPPASTPSTGSTAPPDTDPAAAPTTDPAADASMPGATDNATAVAADIAFQGGLIGEPMKLVIYAGRVPEVFGRYPNSEQVRSDQRQIIYWFEPNRGLYRRERPWVTADGVRNSIDTDPDAPDSVLLAEEVTSVDFQYTDGTSGSWVTEWNGTDPGPDGVTPLGPPRAVKVTLDLRILTGKGDPITKQVSQVIVVRSAPGTKPVQFIEAPTDAATEGGTTSDPNASGTTGNTTSGGNSSGMSTGGTPSGTTSGSKPSGSTSAPSSGTTGGSRPTTGSPSSSPSGGSKPSGSSGAPSGSTGAPSGGGKTGAPSGGKR